MRQDTESTVPASSKSIYETEPRSEPTAFVKDTNLKKWLTNKSWLLTLVCSTDSCSKINEIKKKKKSKPVTLRKICCRRLVS